MATAAHAPKQYLAQPDDGDDSVPLDASGIEHTVNAALEPLPAAARLAPKALTFTADLLRGHFPLLLAEAPHRTRQLSPRGPGLIGHLLMHSHQQTFRPFPDPRADTEAAHAWILEGRGTANCSWTWL